MVIKPSAKRQHEIMNAGPPPITGLTRCQCGGCGEVFNSVGAFDKHRTPDGCLDELEMLGRGMSVNEDGYWITQVWTGREG